MSLSRYLLCILFITGLHACGDKQYVAHVVQEVPYRPNVAFSAYEDISLARFDSIKTIYQLDTLFKGGESELERILFLRNWIRRNISINDFGDPYPGNDHPAAIIDAAHKGQGFHCGHYMVVQNAIMNAYGFVTRCLGSGPGIKDSADGHHGMNEIWLNSHGKWMLSDAKFDHHFEHNGTPLSALEVRAAYIRNKAADLTLVKGPQRTPIQFDYLADRSGRMMKKDKQWFAQWYTWLEWDRKNNRFSAWPEFDSPLNMISDEYSQTHTWIWDGKPHWAYGTDQMNLLKNVSEIEWTPNVINPVVTINDSKALISLQTSTPNIRQYEVDHGNAKWVACDSVFETKLTGRKHELSFRTVNLAGVAGPVSKVIFNR